MQTKVLVVLALAMLSLITHLGAAPIQWYGLNSPTNASFTAVAAVPYVSKPQWVVVGRNSAILTSPDGLRWKQIPFEGGGDFLSLTYGNGIFVAGGTSNNLICTSRDGTNWFVQATASTTEAIRGLTFGSGRFVGVGTAAGVAYIMTSTNGTNWTYPSPPTSIPLHAVTFRGDNFDRGLFVAVGDFGRIITSSNGVTWTRRTSVTPVSLRAVSYDAYRFVAGGDSDTTSTSDDGKTWTLGAPPSFEVKGLARGSINFNSGVMAVGNYESEGRMHGTTDGRVWPGVATRAPRALNAVAYGAYSVFIAVGEDGSIFTTAGNAAQFTNSWIKTTSGRWEEPYWSIDEPPAFWNEQVAFTNEGSLVLSVNANTAATYPNSLHIRSLIVNAPDGSENLLLLDNAGVEAPLNIADRMVIGRNGALASYGSGLIAGTLDVSKRAVFGESSHSQFTNVHVRDKGAAEVVLSNGFFGVSQTLRLGASYGPSNPGAGVFTQYGGSNHVNWLHVSEGVYHMVGGTLEVIGPNGGIAISPLQNPGSARLNISGGSVRSSSIYMGRDFGTSEVSLSGGTFSSQILQLWNGPALFHQNGGSSDIHEFSFYHTNAEYRLSAGDLVTSRIYLNAGLIYQTGGSHSNSGTVNLIGNSAYQFEAGRFQSGTVSVQRAEFVQNGGTNRIERLSVSDDGQFTLRGGELVTAKTVVGINFRRGMIEQMAGTHAVDALTVMGGSVYELHGGALSARTIWLDWEGELQLMGGTVQNNLRITFANGTLRTEGNWQLGILVLTNPGPSRIEFPAGVPARLQFRESRFAEWDQRSELQILNWTGTINGGTTHRIYVGSNSQGLTSEQIGRVAFSNPVGFREGRYAARILATGEIVPALPPSLAFNKAGGRLVLSWPEGYYLYSSTNASGPYRLATSSSPYTNAFRQPQEFFFLRSTP